jgi:hypothetical protein
MIYDLPFGIYDLWEGIHAGRHVQMVLTAKKEAYENVLKIAVPAGSSPSTP